MKVKYVFAQAVEFLFLHRGELGLCYQCSAGAALFDGDEPTFTHRLYDLKDQPLVVTGVVYVTTANSRSYIPRDKGTDHIYLCHIDL